MQCVHSPNPNSARPVSVCTKDYVDNGDSWQSTWLRFVERTHRQWSFCPYRRRGLHYLATASTAESGIINDNKRQARQQFSSMFHSHTHNTRAVTLLLTAGNKTDDNSKNILFARALNIKLHHSSILQ